MKTVLDLKQLPETSKTNFQIQFDRSRNLLRFSDGVTSSKFLSCVYYNNDENSEVGISIYPCAGRNSWRKLLLKILIVGVLLNTTTNLFQKDIKHSKMKLYQSAQRQFALLGISSQLLIQKYPFNEKILLMSFSYICKIISFCMFMYYNVNTFREYTDSIYVTSTVVLIVICYANVVFRVAGFFKFIDSCDEIVATSEWSWNCLIKTIWWSVQSLIEIENISGLKYPGSEALYGETNRQIEKWSEYIEFAAAKMTPICLILPKSLASFIFYLTTDLGSESFDLPLPMWWVCKLSRQKSTDSRICFFFISIQRFPFDSNNPIGYSCAIALQYIMTANIFAYVGSITCLGIGAFLLLTSGCRDVRHNLILINKMAKLKRKRLKCLKHITAFVRVHSDMKQLCACDFYF